MLILLVKVEYRRNIKPCNPNVSVLFAEDHVDYHPLEDLAEKANVHLLHLSDHLHHRHRPGMIQ